MAELGRRTVASVLPWMSSLSWASSLCRSPLALGVDYANSQLHCGAAQVLVRFKGYLGRFFLVLAVPADVFVFVLFALASGSVTWVSWTSVALLVQGRVLVLVVVSVLLLHFIKATGLSALACCGSSTSTPELGPCLHGEFICDQVGTLVR